MCLQLLMMCNITKYSMLNSTYLYSRWSTKLRLQIEWREIMRRNTQKRDNSHNSIDSHRNPHCSLQSLLISCTCNAVLWKMRTTFNSTKCTLLVQSASCHKERARDARARTLQLWTTRFFFRIARCAKQLNWRARVRLCRLRTVARSRASSCEIFATRAHKRAISVTNMRVEYVCVCVCLCMDVTVVC